MFALSMHRVSPAHVRIWQPLRSGSMGGLARMMRPSSCNRTTRRSPEKRHISTEDVSKPQVESCMIE